ncbi:peptidyl-prolyl cis-trans isomerase (macronuclear) [Tetrahymena thermophila SB210]|uniref:Peptidyl-prolyl cis-trans isomerase n=1 Tax=Tetrahymena thermophila (strain SB210) TaxID=312017 RepID=Q24FD8_TETTS|nr:peptidyl-prolyl cis-trans isomerase [Tetrahymena thermophila SB210]EAS06520.1 peptidyl-prolyl cis-trans isomerase [Tetrahymena thermophila SB210]|eukprot:XP_001026765.1 peptidyl-prolyl cis-trans isomerase [Tetrahymena thermophila SB210]
MNSQTIRAAHILQKHRGSRNPLDRVRNVQVTRTLDEAKKNVAAFREQIMKSADPQKTFMEIAQKYSECTSARNGGDLGEFGPGQMQESFEQAAYALKVGEISNLVESDSGVHIILRLD